MTRNLFLTGNQDLMKEIVIVNYNYDLDKFLIDNDKKGGHFFYYNRKNKNLYYGIISSINKFQYKHTNKKHIDELSCDIKFKNGFFQIRFEKKIKKESLNILKDVYAKRNKKLIGDRGASLYYSLKSSNFKYALPIIDETLFMNSNVFIEKILYDASIIPNKSEKRKTFAKIVNEDGQYFLTLMNEVMLQVDYEFLLNELTGIEYRPYFYEFFLDENQNDYLKEGIDKEIYIEGKLYEIELYSIKEKNILENDKDQIFKGQVMFSASPTRDIPAYLKILQTEIEDSIIRIFEDIDRLLKNKANLVKDKKFIEDSFMEKLLLSNDLSLNIKYETIVFNVGQGNWILILIYKGATLISKIIFDIGIGNKIDKKLRDSITSQASQEITDNYLFMLSHWDLDHIKGITELNRSQFETTWIVPEIPDSARQSAKRLAAFLIINSNITSIFIPNSLNGETIFTNTYFELGKGYGNGEWHECETCANLGKKGCQWYREGVSYTAENNLGLILVIKTKDKKMLFPGDCEYIQFPSQFINQNYDALVVSHHGATIKQKDLESLGFINSGKNKFAVVCVGRKHKDEDKNYPKKLHETSIINLGFKLVKTRDYMDINNPCKYKLI